MCSSDLGLGRAGPAAAPTPDDSAVRTWHQELAALAATRSRPWDQQQSPSPSRGEPSSRGRSGGYGRKTAWKGGGGRRGGYARKTSGGGGHYSKPRSASGSSGAGGGGGVTKRKAASSGSGWRGGAAGAVTAARGKGSKTGAKAGGSGIDTMPY